MQEKKEECSFWQYQKVIGPREEGEVFVLAVYRSIKVREKKE